MSKFAIKIHNGINKQKVWLKKGKKEKKYHLKRKKKKSDINPPLPSPASHFLTKI